MFFFFFYVLYVFFFFFQAEDGIRDLYVTGVQTCALPISWLDHAVLAAALGVLLAGFSTVIGGADWWFTTFLVCALVGLTCAVLRAVGRSEEHTSELQSRRDLVCRLLLEKQNGHRAAAAAA